MRRKICGVHGETVLFMHGAVGFVGGNSYGKLLALFPAFHSLFKAGNHLPRSLLKTQRMAFRRTVKFATVSEGSHVMHNYGIAVFDGHEALPARFALEMVNEFRAFTRTAAC